MYKLKFLNFFKSRVRNIFFWMAEKHQNRNILIKRANIKKCTFNDDNINRDSVISTLEYSILHVPFYKKNLSKELLDKIKKDFQYFYDIPVIQKKDIINDPDSFISDEFDKTKLIQMKTGGSTGPSMFVYYDQEAADWSSATTLYCRNQYESWLNNAELHFACDFGDPPATKMFNWRHMGKQLALNRCNIFTLSFDESSLDRYLENLLLSQVNLVHGHPSTMYQIAQYSIRKYGDGKRAFRVFESSGEVIFPYQIEAIKKAFNCIIVNRYGLAEAGVVAYQMKSTDNAMTIQSHLVHMDFNAAIQGPQKIVITTLKNRAMPLIRYDTGDLGIFRSNNNSYWLENIQGRVHDFLEIGEKNLSTHALMDIFDHRIGGILEWQIIQSIGDGSLKVLIVPIDLTLDSKRVSGMMRKYLGCQIPFEIVTHEQLIRVGVREKFRHLVKV